MKRLGILFASLLFVLTISSQNRKSIREAGVAFTGLDRYGLIYRFGTESALWRVNIVSVRYGISDYNSISWLTNSEGRDFGVELGREYRREMLPNLSVRYGADLTYNYGKGTSNSNIIILPTTYTHQYDTEQTNLGLQFVIGMCYTIDRIVIGAELHPKIYYKYVKAESSYDLNSSKSKNSVFYFSLNADVVEFSLSYRL